MKLDFGGDKKFSCPLGQWNCDFLDIHHIVWSTTPSRHQQSECGSLKFVSMNVWLEGEGKCEIHPRGVHEGPMGE